MDYCSTFGELTSYTSWTAKQAIPQKECKNYNGKLKVTIGKNIAVYPLKGIIQFQEAMVTNTKK